MHDGVKVLVGTRKGAFVFRSDAGRSAWQCQGPIKLGTIVNHLVGDPRGGGTMLMAAKTGHLGPTVLRSTDDGQTWQEAKRPPAFPKAAGGEGFKLHPGRGSAVLFYNLLEDGNGDDASLHAALPVTRGEKWLANFWVWDPARK